MPNVFSDKAVHRIRRSVKYTEGQRRDLRGPHHEPIRRGGAGTLMRRFRVTNLVQDGDNKRWVYSGLLQTKQTVGYGGWADDPDDGDTHTLYNDLEDRNGSSGTYGNGATQGQIDAANGGVGDYDLRPIPLGVIVAASIVIVPGDPPTQEWWIVNYNNGVWGTC